MVDFEVFKSFFIEADARSLLTLLKGNGIDAIIEKRRPIADKVIAGDGMNAEILLKINPRDFEKANKLIDEHILQHISDVESDYYLFSFSDKELIEILHKPDEWNNQDVIIARKILDDRGHVISENDLAQIKSSRIKELGEPESEESSYILGGYISAIFAIGIFWGLFFLYGKKLLPNGRKVYIYNEQTRNHGKNIVIISSLILGIALLLKFAALFIKTG
jgi:hypothetical protein